MLHDDFDTQIQPEELIFNEDILDDNPIDEDYEMNEIQDYYGNNSFEEQDEFNDGEGW